MTFPGTSSQAGPAVTSPWSKSSGPSGVSRKRCEKPRSVSVAFAGGRVVVRTETPGSSTVTYASSQKIAIVVRILTRGSAGSRRPVRSTGIVFVFPAGNPNDSIATFQPPRPSGTSRTGGKCVRSLRCESETLIDVSV